MRATQTTHSFERGSAASFPPPLPLFLNNDDDGDVDEDEGENDVAAPSVPAPSGEPPVIYFLYIIHEASADAAAFLRKRKGRPITERRSRAVEWKSSLWGILNYAEPRYVRQELLIFSGHWLFYEKGNYDSIIINALISLDLD